MEVHARKSTYMYPSHQEDTLPSSSSYSNSSSKSSRPSSAPCLIRSWRHRWFQKWKATIVVLVVLANVAVSVWVVFFDGNLSEMFPGGYHTNMRLLSMKKCHFPELDPFTSEIKHLLIEPKKIDCASAANSDFINSEYGKVAFKTDRNNNLIRFFNPGIPCCYRPFYRTKDNDNEVWIEPTPFNTYVCHNITQQVTKIGPEHEFIEVICEDGRRSYRDGFAFVHRKPKVEKRIRKIQRMEEAAGRKPDRLSVMILGFDSTSQLNFIRRMPKSVEYLNSLEAVRLDGYTKVGENTLPNLAPLLTGLDLSELKELCIEPNPSSETAVHIDHCPFIWKNFSSRGYRTSFSEDDPTSGIFNLYWSHAFIKPPTDHYFRPFSLRMHNAQNSYEGTCYGSRLSFEHLLDNLKNIAATYKDDLVFQFSWSNKLTWLDFNRLSWADYRLLETLKFLKENGKLNNTALILLSDHGSRKQEVRQTRQGQLEDRMPLAYIVLPPWFSSKYPLAMQNLKKNAQSLTSAFDMHETLKDFFDLSSLADLNVHYKRLTALKIAEYKGVRKGTSLFTAHPEHRGCISAGIPPHWCICYKKFPISNKAPEVYEAMGFIIRTLDLMLMPYKHKCDRLQWKKITSVLKWHPEEMIESTFNGNSEENHKRSSLYQISFETKPGNAQFEITVLHEPGNVWKLTEQVVRLDPYADHSYCMEKQELKKICHCSQPMEDSIFDERHPDFIVNP